MKNNIRYKGNTSNTSVIIFFFLIESQKLPAMVLCLGEFPVRFLLLFISDLRFIFVSSFHFCIFIFVVALHLSLFFIHLLFDIIPHPSMEYIAGFLHPFYTFSPARRRVIRNTFVFNYSGIFLPRALRFLSGRFLPIGFFYLTLLHRHF